MKRLSSTIALLALCLCSGLTASAQTRTVSGSVKGSDGEILAGATILDKANNAYAIADIDGTFSLQSSEGDVLVVSCLGYDDASVTVGALAYYEIVLNVSKATMLDETVVIGYGHTTKKEITGSVANIRAEDLDLGTYTSAAGMLQGKVAGLSVVNPDGGDPNGSFEILLRGTNTLKAGQGPLVIIDGVAGADIRNINFQEVESIDVLKDGSAAAIYGTRGTNGVLIITTKRAKSGTASVEYDGQVSVQTVRSRAIPMTAEQFKYSIENYSPANSSSLYGSDTDWFDEITRTPISHKHSFAVSGGSENFSHRTVINVEQNQGVQLNNQSQKYLFKTNISQKAIEGWLNLDYNFSYVKRIADYANYDAFRQAFFHNPTEPVYDETNDVSGGYYRIVGMDYYNPVAMVMERTDTGFTNNLGANVRATLNILPIKGLKWDNFVSYNTEVFENRSYRTHFYPSLIGKEGKAEISNSSYVDLQYESTLQYSNLFGKHSVQAVLGYSWQRGESRSSSMENFGYDSDVFQTDNIGKGSALALGLAGMSSYREANKYIAFFGRVMYNYDEKYLLSASLRRDGSSRFGANNKWGWFPAVSLGWRINKEDWMESLTWVYDLKLRAGYGVTGNQDFANYKSLLLMEPKGYFYYNGAWINSYSPVSNANPDLAWEKKKEFNIGLDYGFLDGRIGGCIDYYYRLTTDLLYEYNVPVPPYDYRTMFTNVGSISNTGIEFTLYATPIKNGVVTWSTSFTAAHNKNKLISFTDETYSDTSYRIGWLNTPIGEYCQRLVEGESLGSFYGPKFKYVDPDTGKDKLENSIAGSVAEGDWENLGTAYPVATLGWNNNLKVGNFGISLSLRSGIGGKVFNTMRAEFENINAIGLKNIMASWLDQPYFTGQVTYSSKYLEDATYLKVDNLTFTYDIPVRSGLVKGITLSLTGQDLLCLTAYSGVDPEVNLGGLTPGIEGQSYYPRTRTFTFGAKLRF